ncbi:SGNH/GDSL hydrolase family protein [Paenibacillus rhizolycopersici]|uniref:SGNH/GDSL hydrolase family protein n=1 Tax=Paenibacillus rhizolycopersici TaxID=2780073 RepID=UPI003D28B8C6
MNNIKNWGGLFYNAGEYDIVPGVDVTEKLQALVNLANSEGRSTIVFPEAAEYIVTSITNDGNIVYFGDGASFTGGYGRVINSLADSLSIDEQLADVVQSTDKDFDKIYNPTRYGAVGNGTTNDTAAFTALEVAVTGKQIDLGNKTYVVDSVPRKNLYYNGFFKVSGYTRSVVLDTPPRFHAFGGQLAKLKASLGNPLEQYTGIVFIGDSITWGRALPENGAFDPRDGTLSDPRDVFGSPSFVNEFKRYIGAQYGFGSYPVLSNWPASPSGESTAEYTVQQILYPKDGDFTLTTTGTNATVAEVASGGSITGYQLQLSASSSGTGVHTIGFNFTGDSFTLCFGATNDALNYELFVNGVSQGVFSATPGTDGVVVGNNNQRVHTFTYVRNKLIEIKTVQAGYVGIGRFRPEGIIVNKKIRIINQGINGSSARVYKTNALSGNTFGDGDAVGTYDNYTFVQLGTNDRITRSDTPKGTNKFKVNLKGVIDAVTPLSNVILMCANPVSDESTSTYNFTMQQVRGVIYDLAKANNIDMIDNYAAWRGLEISSLSSDGLHPNALGHQVIARNIIGALENA